MRNINITSTCQIEKRSVLKDKMERTVSMIPGKVSTSNINSKPLTGDETTGIDSDIRFYLIYDVGKSEEGEEAVIIVINNSILATPKIT